MAMSLYEIDSRIKAIIDALMDSVDENGEIKDFDISELEELKEAKQVKLENIALYIKNLDAEAVAIKAEENTLKERRESIERKSERLRTALINSLQEDGKDELTSPKFVAKIKVTERTEILDIDKIPEKFIKVKTEKTADKTEIKKAIKSGVEIEGARIVPNTTINIK